MTKGKKGDKGDKMLRAKQALAAEEKVAKAQTGSGAADSKVAVSTDEHQKEDGDGSAQPKKKRKKEKADKSDPSYRTSGDTRGPKVISKKALGLLPKQGFQGMDTAEDRKDDLEDYEPDDGEKIGTGQEAQNQQSGSRQNSADGGELEEAMMLYKTPSKATHPR
jgi:hypothetical protein